MNKEISIIHTNDMHNRLPADFEKFSHCHDLLLDGGDAIGGSNTLFRLNEPILERMGRLGYNAMVVGNREFHYIRSIMRKRQKEAGFPFLSANIFDITGESNRIISPFLLKEVKGLSIAIIGLTVQVLPPGSFWEKIMRFKFLDPVDTLGKYVPELKRKSDLLIVISHLGKDVDVKLAEHFRDINIIIGGHSHTPLEKPLISGNTMILQAGFWAASFGHLILSVKKVEDRWHIEKHSYSLIKI